MQGRKKIIIGATSLIFIIAIVITMKFRVAKINNNELMKNEVSSIPEREDSKINKEEKSNEDATSSASEKEEAIDEDSDKCSNGKNGDTISSASEKEKNISVVSKNTIHNKNSQSKENGDTTSSASIKEENYLNNVSKLNKDINSNNEGINKNKKEDVVSSASKKEHENTSINTNKNQKNSLSKDENKIASLEKVKSVNDGVSSASKKEYKGIENTSQNKEIKVSSDSFIKKAINKNATKLVDLGWVKYIVVTFNEGTIKNYDLYVLDNGSYKAITPSKVDDNGKIVKWEIDKLGYNTIKVKNKNSGEEVIYKFAK